MSEGLKITIVVAFSLIIGFWVGWATGYPQGKLAEYNWNKEMREKAEQREFQRELLSKMRKNQ